MLYIFIVISALMPIFFIIRRQSVDDGQTLLLKCLSTFIIAFLSILNLREFNGEILYFAMTFTGLVLCLIGDFLLGYCHVLGKGNKLYNIFRGVGMLIFMFAHIVFLTNYAIHINDMQWIYILIPICMAILLFALCPVAHIKWPNKALAVLSLFYLLTILLMLFFGLYYAIQVIFAGGERSIFKATMVILASTIFFTSDMTLSFMYFGGKKGTPISVFNLSTYYMSLIFLALAF